MRHKKAIIKVAGRLPVSNVFIKKYKNLKKALEDQQNEIIGLRQAVKRLEDRNDEWAAEVRELRGDGKPLTVVWPVTPEDIIKANWMKPISSNKVFKKTKPPLTISWVIPPMEKSSGGHADILRTINYLESKGHTCQIYIYDALKQSSLAIVKQNLTYYAPVQAEIFYNQENIADCDALFATNWHTAYPVFNYQGRGKKYYYVQDFEPYFEPVGTYSTLTENTYHFGLRGITLGRWLSEKLSKEYDMECDYFELGSNSEEYYLTNPNPRKKIFFYARPVTPRRGFEVGVLALEVFHKEHPEYEINFVGWDTSRFKIPFPYNDLGILPVAELNKLYNQCAAGLVLSFTNMSLLPLEMLACGCRPVVNDSEHTRLVDYNKQLKYSAVIPTALAESLYEAIKESDQTKIKDMAEFSKKFEWNKSNKVIEDILLKELVG